MDAVTGFDGLAEAYDAYRPAYPVQLFRDLAAMCSPEWSWAVDVGAGTGISTEGLAAALPKTWLVIGVEPNADMRRVLNRRMHGHSNFQADASMAEDIALPDATAGLVTAFTAIHWFDRAAFFAQARRLLKPGGVLAIARNRREGPAVVGAFDAWVREASNGVSDIDQLDRFKEPDRKELEAIDGFRGFGQKAYPWSSHMEKRDLIDLYLTRAMVARLVQRIGLRAVIDRLDSIYAEHNGAASVRIDWRASLYWVRRV